MLVLAISLADHVLCSFLYILEPNATSVQVMSVNVPGQAKELNSFNLAGPAQASGLLISTYLTPFPLRTTSDLLLQTRTTCRA